MGGPAGTLIWRRARNWQPWRTRYSVSSSAALERAAVDKKAVDLAGALGERLAQHDRPALRRRALAGGGRRKSR